MTDEQILEQVRAMGALTDGELRIALVAVKALSNTESCLAAFRRMRLAILGDAKSDATTEQIVMDAITELAYLRTLAEPGLYEQCEATYLGGYSKPEEIAIFRHGMATVCNVVKASAKRAAGAKEPTTP